jgi:hypothetical protein
MRKREEREREERGEERERRGERVRENNEIWVFVWVCLDG